MVANVAARPSKKDVLIIVGVVALLEERERGLVRRGGGGRGNKAIKGKGGTFGLDRFVQRIIFALSPSNMGLLRPTQHGMVQQIQRFRSAGSLAVAQRLGSPGGVDDVAQMGG